MAVTKDAAFPESFAQLVLAMNAVCEGQTLEAVEQASANMLSAVIHNGAKMRGIPDEAFRRHARLIVEGVFNNAVENWNRSAQPADVPVKLN